MSTAVERQVLAGVPRRLAGIGAQAPARPSTFVAWALLLFLVLEYVRPPGIVQLKLQMLFAVVLPVLWLQLNPRPWSRNLTLQLLFVLQAGASIAYASNWFSAWVRTRQHFATFVVALAITWVLADRKNFERTVWFWVGIMSYQALYSFLHAGRGAGGFIGDENDLALACATVFPFVYAGMLYSKQRLLCLLMAMLYSAAIVFSWSRGGFLGLLAATLYCVLVGRHKVRNISVGVVAAFLFYLALPASYKAELGTIQEIQESDKGTSEGRFFLWQAATNMWLDHPIQGVGAGNSPWLIGEYQPRETEGDLFNRPMYMKRNWSGTVVHSLYFELLAENGLIGVAIFLGVVYLHFKTLRRLRREVTRDSRASPELKRKVDLYVTGLAGAGVAYLVAGAFLAVLYYPYLWYFSAMAVALDRWVRSELEASAAAPAPAPAKT